jgi:hypothetical protein
MYAKVERLTRRQLDAMANPELAGEPEALPWVLYDTQLLTSGTTTTMTFFQTVQADKTLSNMESQGQLPDPQYFRVFGIGCDILAPPTFLANVITGAINDIEVILKTQRGIFTLQQSNKGYGPFPLTFLHGSGGATGAIAASYTAPQNFQQANNGIFDGGFPVAGSYVIPPKVGFSVRLDFAAAPTLSGNIQIRVWLFGVLYRRVL